MPKPGARVQAAIVLLLVAAVGALAGITGDRIIAQQRTDAAAEQPAPPDVQPVEAQPVEIVPADSPVAVPAPQQEPSRTQQEPPRAQPQSEPQTDAEFDDVLLPPQMRQPRRAPQGPRYVEQLGALLDLTPEQQTAIDGIVAEEQTRIRRLNQEMQPRFMQIVRQTQQRVNQVLTPEQRLQLRTLRQERMEGMMQERRGMRAPPPGRRPPPR